MNTFFQYLYRVLNKFVNIETITLERNNLSEIPDHAFSRDLVKLKSLSFSSFRFNKLGNLAFAKLPSLEYLIFEYVEFEKIPVHAFVFEDVSRKKLTIKFKNIKTWSDEESYNFKYEFSIFQSGSLANINRTTDIIFEGHPSALTLDKNDIRNFLRANEKNTIDFGMSYIYCDRCIRLTTAINRVKNLKCSNLGPKRVYEPKVFNEILIECFN